MLFLRSSVAVLSLATVVQAGPLRRLLESFLALPHSSDSNSIENCENVCRSPSHQVCCAVGDSCLTDSAGAASCGPRHLEARQAGSGYYQVYTSTWVETNLLTRTSVYSSWIAQSTCTPNFAAGQAGCGPRCCEQGNYCYDQNAGICSPLGGAFTTTGIAPPPGGSGTVAVRPTTISGVVVTQTINPTFTTTFSPAATGTAVGGSGSTPQASSSGGSHLSAGAIAGIVIGVLLAVLILFFICVCCCIRAGIHSIEHVLAFFGIGKRRSSSRRSRGSTEYIEEVEEIHRHRGGNGRSNAGGSRRWAGSVGYSDSYDSRYSRPRRDTRRGGAGGNTGGGWASRFAAIGAPAFLFGGNKNQQSDRRTSYREKDRRTQYEDEYSDSYGSYDSRDRRTRRSGGGGGPPRSEYTRRSSGRP